MAISSIVVMSACLKPNGMVIAKESIEGREQQYLNTINFYSSQPFIKHLVFADNSNADLSHLKAVAQHSEKITWLSFDLNNFPPQFGKGYGDFCLLDSVVEVLPSYFEIDQNTYFVRVTGRFPILNIETILEEYARKKNLQFMLDIVDHPFYDWLHLGWNAHYGRAVTYAVNLQFYRQWIRGRYVECPIPYEHAEWLLFDIWRKTKKLPGVYPRFRHEPILSGHAGSVKSTIFAVTNYDGWLAKTKRTILQAMRCCVPWLKL